MGYSELISFFQGEHLPEQASQLVGYSALIKEYHLEVPLPDLLCAIGHKHKRYQQGNWLMFPPSYRPDETLQAHLAFALKYEGVNLSVLSALFKSTAKQAIIDMITQDPLSTIHRRIWFLYEWITGISLDIADIQDNKLNYVSILDSKLQYPGPIRRSKRHRVNNNLPGVANFCPIIRRTPLLDNFINTRLDILAESELKQVHPDLLMRAAAFLLLEDSKASYAIEGETPPQNRAERWGTAIGQAGKHPLSHDEFLRLQEIVIADFRYTHFGYRVEGGFIGKHDRSNMLPIPSHISARYQDVYELMDGLIETDNLLKNAEYNAVLAAAMIAFGLVFIHPFEDGNGRIHRYLIHHVLAQKDFTPDGVVFPVSHVILKKIREYQMVLETYSKPRLKLVEWHPTERGNVVVTNETKDLYRYFDATKQAEFLFSCIKETIETVLPAEIDYLRKYDEIKSFIQHTIEMPDRLVSLLIVFLEQNKGKLSKRAREKEYTALTDEEVRAIESKFQSVFNK